MMTIAISSPVDGTVCRKTSLHTIIPVVSRFVPERHEKPLRGSFSSPIQLFVLFNGFSGKFIDLYCEVVRGLFFDKKILREDLREHTSSADSNQDKSFYPYGTHQ